MVIFFILSALTYVNYSYYANISRVKLSAKEVSQWINDARNMAINGYDKNGVNQSIGIYFEVGKSELTYYAYDYTQSGATLLLDDSKKIKSKKLQDSIQIANVQGKTNAMIYFSSITGKSEIFYFLPTGKEMVSSGALSVDIAYKNANNSPLRKTIQYYQSTNMIDY